MQGHSSRPRGWSCQTNFWVSAVGVSIIRYPGRADRIIPYLGRRHECGIIRFRADLRMWESLLLGSVSQFGSLAD